MSCMYKILNYKKAIFLITLSFFMIPVFNVSAQPVYRSTSPSGKSSFYTSHQRSHDQEPEKLPEIKRVDIKGATVVRQTCQRHGGVNCNAGKDNDGSVVCYDGFRGSEERFNFNCTTPKLEIIQISPDKSSTGFNVLLRNLTAVEASNVSVTFTPDSGGEFKLAGSLNIKGFESGEYSYMSSDRLHHIGPPDQSTIKIKCANCP